ncbi:DedA family protein [Candidatus Bathyarchaeota archaeon]|nr:DedA family protein [Candidatus Bathyarchaeota archaeon]MBS7635963.1 DedA family protein [Candidatus Bathyarchaeota archaeon]
MKPNAEKEAKQNFSDVVKTSWVKSAIIVGLVFLAIGIAAIFIFKAVNIGSFQIISDVKAFAKDYGILGVFLATILAGTVIPLGSPALVVAAASLGIHPLPLVVTATIGFTTGMTINYFLAYRLGRTFVIKRLGAEKLEEATFLWSRWGWILYTLFGLIPFLPVEFLALVCGLLKASIKTFLVLSFMPRLMVFAVLAYFGEAIGSWIGII